VVTLADTLMKTRFGGRQRPHLIVKRCIALGGETLPPASTTPQLPPAAASESVSASARTVEPPSLAEEMKDSIQY
jgi:hypothetical protein